MGRVSRFRKVKAVSDWSDADMLRALQMADAGISATQIGAVLGRSRSAVCGILKRIADDLAASEAGPK